MKATIYSTFLFLIVVASSCNRDIGEVTLTYNKATAVYGNLEEVRSTPLISSSREIIDPGKIFMGENALLVGEEGQGIHVFDNNDPNNPSPVIFIDLPFTNEFFVYKNYIYAVSHYDMVKININNLAAPELVDREMNAFSEPITNDQGEALIGFTYAVVTETLKINGPEARALQEESTLYFDYMDNMIPRSNIPSSFAGNGTTTAQGTTNRIALTEDHVYVVADNTLLTFGNTSVDLNLIEKQHIQWGMETVYQSGDQLFIGTQTSMVIVDISIGENPTVLSTYWHPNSCDPVLPHGSLAYVTLRSAVQDGCAGDENSLTVVDISDLQDPRDLTTVQMESPFGMCLQEDHLLIGEGTNGISIFDVNVPSMPFISMHFPHEIYDVLPHPTVPNRILAAGPNGLSQYQMDYTEETMTLLSSIAF